MDTTAFLKTKKGERFKMRLIKRARRKYNNIYPTINKTNMDECFTSHDNKLIFWFNTQDKSTHIETVKI